MTDLGQFIDQLTSLIPQIIGRGAIHFNSIDLLINRSDPLCICVDLIHTSLNGHIRFFLKLLHLCRHIVYKFGKCLRHLYCLGADRLVVWFALQIAQRCIEIIKGIQNT